MMKTQVFVKQNKLYLRLSCVCYLIKIESFFLHIDLKTVRRTDAIIKRLYLMSEVFRHGDHVNVDVAKKGDN